MNQTNSDRIHRLNCLASDLDAIYHQAALKLGLPDSAMYVLYLLYENGESCLLSDIPKKTGISKQTIHSAVRRLEREDIIYLDEQNKRAKMIHLTKTGLSYVKQTAARLFEAECCALQNWSEEDISLYLNLMEKYNTSLRAQIEQL